MVFGYAPPSDIREKMEIGKYPRTTEHRVKMSEIQRGHFGYTKGIPLTDEHKRKIGMAKLGKKNPKLSEALKGKTSPMKGKHHTPEAKKKLSEAHTGKPNPKIRGKNNPQWRGGKVERECQICEKTFEVIPSLVKNGGGKYCSQMCFHVAMSKRFLGKNNPQWKGGVTKVRERIRASLKYRQWRQNVFIRDDFTCQECGKRGGDLEAHHIKLFKTLFEEAGKFLPLFNPYEAAMAYTPLWDIDNGVTLCLKCHKEYNKREV